MTTWQRPFEQRLAGLESPAVISVHVESGTCRGHDYVRVTVLITVSASDVAAALEHRMVGLP